MTQSRFADEDTLAHIAQLEAENARLREELAAAQKDAERYRWIKEESQPHQWAALDDTPYAQWDAAIDKARKEK